MTRPHLRWEIRERIARSIHQNFQRRRLEHKPSDPAQVGWNEHDEEYRNANRAQADAIYQEVASVGRRIVPSRSPAEKSWPVVR